MEFPIDQIGSYVEIIQDNIGTISASLLAVIAGFDKIALVFIKTLANVRDSWRESFGAK